MAIKGTEGLSNEDVQHELDRGARFITYHYCISILIMTFRRSSDIHFVKAGENSILKGSGYSLLTLFAGWWGIPWGPIYTITSLAKNLGGGTDVTQEVLAQVSSAE